MSSLNQHNHQHSQFEHQIQFKQNQTQDQHGQEIVTLNDAISNVDVLDALELPDSQPCITGNNNNNVCNNF